MEYLMFVRAFQKRPEPEIPLSDTGGPESVEVTLK